MIDPRHVIKGTFHCLGFTVNRTLSRVGGDSLALHIFLFAAKRVGRPSSSGVFVQVVVFIHNDTHRVSVYGHFAIKPRIRSPNHVRGFQAFTWSAEQRTLNRRRLQTECEAGGWKSGRATWHNV